MTGPGMPARILLADDHALVRRGVRLILDAQPDLEVVAEAGDGAEAVALLRDPTSDLAVDLAILDVAMPRLTGLQAAREISRMRTPPTILMLSMHDNEQYFFESLKVGASGYVLKSVADRDLVDACHAALRGEPFLYPGSERRLVRDYLERLRRGERLPPAALTPREDEVVKLIAEGHSSREIARELTISVRTVERHRENVLQKLGMRDRTELTRYAVRVGLIDP
jgi:DNA-binding NarL/FixJ family response regulator